MLLSALHEQVKSASDHIREFEIYLASPDVVAGDDVDVYLARIGKVDIDRDKNEITLVPATMGESSEIGIPIVLLSMLLDQLPFDTVLWGDFRILVELPLNRESGRRALKSRVSVKSLHVGQASGEAWFLVRPAPEYASNVLPA
jgi:hypothetical protein